MSNHHVFRSRCSTRSCDLMSMSITDTSSTFSFFPLIHSFHVLLGFFFVLFLFLSVTHSHCTSHLPHFFPSSFIPHSSVCQCLDFIHPTFLISSRPTHQPYHKQTNHKPQRSTAF